MCFEATQAQGSIEMLPRQSLKSDAFIPLVESLAA
jgi:hypothetical protein